jgi:hypothetical protein
MLTCVSFTAYRTVLTPPAQLFPVPQHDDASMGNEGEDATGEYRTGQLSTERRRVLIISTPDPLNHGSMDLL